MIIIKEITRRSDLHRYIKFTIKLYKDNTYWVPPIIKVELRSFSRHNPIFEKVNARFYLAYKNNQIVGRVVAIINKIEINQQQKPKVRFGWIEFIDDLEVSKALLDKVVDFGKEHNLQYIEGPVGFTNMDKAGMLTDRKSTRLNSSHVRISYAVFCLKKKNNNQIPRTHTD